MACYNNTHYDQASTVENYDLCRHIPSEILNKFAHHIINIASRSSQGIEGRVLEEGVGNGRILIPVISASLGAVRKDKFFAIDKSALMIEDLKRRLTTEQRKRCKLSLGDIQQELPYEDASMDCIYTFAVYHILNQPDVALDKAVTKLKPHGSFVFGKEFTQVFHGTEGRIEYGDSEDFQGVNLVPCIQDFFHEYHRLRRKNGVPFVASGVLYSDPSLVLEHMKETGFDCSIIRDSNLAYMKPHTFRQMLEAFRLRNITTFGSDIPDEIRLEMYSDLTGWCDKNRVRLDEIINVPASITLYNFSRQKKHKNGKNII